jgi:hypothetical protein
MTHYEYRVVPAPVRGVKARGARSPEDRFALALAQVMNELGADGWDYVRCDTLPCEERTGLTGRTTVYRNMLVFRRAVAPAVEAAPPEPAAAPTLAARIAATLRPGTAPAITPGTTPPPHAPPPLRVVEDAPVAAVSPRPLGPADRGDEGAAPRIVRDPADDPARPGADGRAPG